MAGRSIHTSRALIAPGFVSLFLLLGFHAGPASAVCDISGPTVATANQAFTLCGPTGNGYRYEWYGPGVPSYNSSRCVTVAGRDRGTYEYLLIIKVNGGEIDRCRDVVNVGGATGGVGSCTISGPTSVNAGVGAALCGSDAPLHSYSWSGPNGFSANTRCVTVYDEGTYILTTRNPITGSTRQCTTHLDVVGASTSNCSIAGPDVISSGETARLCGPLDGNLTYEWRGPGGATSSSRCVNVTRLGTYTLVIRDRSTGASQSCSHLLSLDQGNLDNSNDADAVVGNGNCPRGLGFWKQQCSNGQRTGNPNSLSDADMQMIAQRIDQESSYFNWSNDVSGLCQALRPRTPLTQRSRAAREFAMLLANVVCGENDVAMDEGNRISLDRDTDVDYLGNSTTIGELITIADRMLVSGRGSFARLYQSINAINNGRGIGPVCQ